MDRVTRYPIFGIAHSPRLAGLDPSGGTSYTFEEGDVGPEASGWGQDKAQPWPAHREARLSVARTGPPYSPRAFPGRSPSWTLWREGDKDEDARDAQPRRPRDPEQERRAVIQGQALRKNSTAATVPGSPGHPDPRSPGQPQPGPPEESAVDREQIDFLAARQQFLSLEQASAGPPLHPPARVAPAPAPAGVTQAPRAPSGLPLASEGAVPRKPRDREVLPPGHAASGLPAAPGGPAVGEPASPALAGSPALPAETPIEREIRLAQEREADLRERRGLRQARSQQDLVEIPSRPLLTRLSLDAAPRRDRGRPFLYVQRDLAQGTQREEDHRRREGLQAAAPRSPPAPQAGLRRALSSDSILDLVADGGAAEAAPAGRKVSRIPADAYQPFLRPGSPPRDFAVFPARARPRGPSADEAKAAGSPRHLEPSGKSPGARAEGPRPPQGRAPAHGGVVRWEYFHLSPPRFRLPDGPPGAEGPRGRSWEAGATLAPWLQRSASSELLEREVESVLQREREVAEERRHALFPEVFSPPLVDGADDPDSGGSSAASGITGSYSVSGSQVFSPVHLPSGLVWTAEAPGHMAPEQRKKEQRYASINSLDHIDSEVLEATRVTHHKNAMARRWEAGIYTSGSRD